MLNVKGSVHSVGAHAWLMNIDDLVKLVQQHFTDGLVLVVGSGLSAAEGMPTMSGLADYLKAGSGELSGEDAARWSDVVAALDAGNGLEAALFKHPPPESLETWVANSKLGSPRRLVDYSCRESGKSWAG